MNVGSTFLDSLDEIPTIEEQLLPDSAAAASADEERLLLAATLHDLRLHGEAGKLEDCGQRQPRIHKEDPFKLRWCRRKYCPACRQRLAQQAMKRFRPRVHDVLGSNGAVVFLTNTLPPDNQALLERSLNIHRSTRGFISLRSWKGTGGFGRKVGVLSTLELARGNEDPGHPHSHQLIISPSSTDAYEAAVWLQNRWMLKHPDAHWDAQELKGPISNLEQIDKFLGYFFKGPRIYLDWPDEIIRGAVHLFSSGIHCPTASGLGMRGGFVLPPK